MPARLAIEPPSAPQLLREVVAAAVLAPSGHNRQAWRFRIRGARLEVLVDPTRRCNLERDRRQIVQSVGCALYNARVALRAAGFEAKVSPRPDRGRPELLAVIEVGAARAVDDEDRALAEAVARRHSHRGAYLPRAVEASVAEGLARAAAAEGAWLVCLPPPRHRRLEALIAEADQLQLGERPRREDLARWLAAGAEPAAAPPLARPVPAGTARGVPGGAGPPAPGRAPSARPRLDGTPAAGAALVVLGTAADGEDAWLACGQALQAVLLRATAAGLAATFLNQVLELPPLRDEVGRLAGAPGAAQIVLRVGSPSPSGARATGRRALAEVLEIVA